MNDDYPTETVECGACDGCGQVNYEGDYGFDDLYGVCLSCAGSGTVDVCENCLDDWDGCSVCNPWSCSCEPNRCNELPSCPTYALIHGGHGA